MRQWSFAAIFVIAGLLSGGAAAQQTQRSSADAPARSRVKAKLERAYSLMRANRNAEAIPVLNDVLKTDPNNHAALVELGYLHAGLKQGRLATRYFKAALAQDPGNMRLHMDLGYVYQSQKDFAAAGREFELVAQEPGEFQAQAQAAARVLKDAAEAGKPSDQGQRRRLEQGYAALRQGNRAFARKQFEAALRSDPRNAAILRQLGHMSLEAGDLPAAAERFEAARKLQPDDGFVSLQLGYIYQRMNKKEPSAEAFRSALASPDAKIQAAAEIALKPSGTAPQAAAAQP
jgi:Tfp pilus assembly protein PilF